MIHPVGALDRIGRVWKAALLLALGAAGGGVVLAVAAVPDSSGVIHACYQLGAGGAPASGLNLRIIDPSAGQTCNTTSTPAGPPQEATLSWNQAGPPGATGPQGAAGAQGPPGSSGNTMTVTGGSTVNLTGGGTLNLTGGGTLNLTGGGTFNLTGGGTFNLTGGGILNLGGGGAALTLGQAPGVTVLLAPPAVKAGPPGTVELIGKGATITFEYLSVIFGGPGAVKATPPKPRVVEIIASPSQVTSKLQGALFAGRAYPNATITFGKHGGKPYLVYEMSNVTVVGHELTTSKGPTLEEGWTLAYTGSTTHYYK